MGNIKLNESYLFGITLTIEFFLFIYCYQNSIFAISVTIGPCRSLFKVGYHKLFNVIFTYSYFIQYVTLIVISEVGNLPEISFL